MKRKWRVVALVVLVALVLVAVGVRVWPRVWRGYAVMQIEAAKRQGVYASAEAGFRELIAGKYRDIERVEVDHAGPNAPDGRQPHVWFVSARVYAAARPDGKTIAPGDYDYPGSFFLHVDDGWVHVREGAGPRLIGAAMERFGLYGCCDQ